MNNKARIYRDRPAVRLHRHGVSMATQTIVAFEHVDFVPAAQ